MIDLFACFTIISGVFLGAVALFQARDADKLPQTYHYQIGFLDSVAMSKLLGYMLFVFSFCISGLHWGWEYGVPIILGVVGVVGWLFIYILERQQTKLNACNKFAWPVLFFSSLFLVILKYVSKGT